MQIFHSILIFLLLICGLFVFLSENPVHSVLFLILAFCNASAILFLFKVEFLALTFIIIYVGAIAILFLFVVMMLNVKSVSSFNLFSVPFIILGLFIFFLQIFIVIDNIWENMNNLPIDSSFVWDSFTNIEILGQSLYNCYLFCFLVAGLILLIAMLGAIVLTLNFSSDRKNEITSRQLSRSDNFLSFFK
jgi:NADH-quinone oxidoreductase subunit J